MTTTLAPTSARTHERRRPPVRRVFTAVTGLLLAYGIAVAVPASAAATVSPTVAPNSGPVTLTIGTINPHIPGQTIVRLKGPNQISIDGKGTVVSGTTITTTVDLAPGGVPTGPGKYTVYVCDVDCDADAVMANQETGAFQVAGTPPTALQLSPGSLGAGAARVLELTGSDLSSGSKVTFVDRSSVKKDSGGVTATTVKTTSASVMSVSVSASTGAPPGPRDVVLTSSDGQISTLPQGLIINPAPTELVATPKSVGQGAQRFPLILSGRHFVDGAVVTLAQTAGPTGDPSIDPDLNPKNAGITIEQGQFGGITIPLQVTVTAGAELGNRLLVITNPDGGKASTTLSINPAPTFGDGTQEVTADPKIAPRDRGQGAPSTTVSIFGTGFRPGATVDFGPGVTTGTVTVAGDGKTLSVAGVQVSPAARPGSRNVLVVNGDGGRATCISCWKVTAAPTVTAVNPASLGRAAEQFIQVAGTGLTATTKVEILDVTVKSTAFSEGVLSVAVAVPAAAKPGLKKITTTNADGGSATCADCFSVDSFPVKSVSPESATNLRPVTLTATGSKIPPRAVGSLVAQPQVAGQGPIPATESTTSSTGTTYSGTFDLAGAAPGTYVLRLADATGIGTCTCSFTVVGGQPRITQVTPPAVSQGSSAAKVSIHGSNLSRGALISFPASSGVTVDETKTTVVGSDRIDAVLTVGRNATIGPVEVSVTNTDKQSGTCPACLSVQQAAAITSVSPDKVPQGANKQTVTITGQSLPPSVSLDFGPGVSVEGNPDVSGGTVTAVVDVSATAPAGPRTVVLTGPDGATASCSGCFTVLAAKTTSGLFSTLEPTRLLDTRASSSPVRAGADHRLTIAGAAGVPADATAVVLNVTVTGAQQPGHLSVYPHGTPSGTSNLNFVPGQTIANAVTVLLGSGGAVGLHLSAGRAHVVVDVFGYYRRADTGSTFTSVAPERLLDTRSGGQRVAAGADRQLRVAGEESVPSDASAVVLNLTVTEPNADGHLTVYPSGRPTATSNLNFLARRTVANLIVVKLGEQGGVGLRVSRGSAHVIADVFGYYRAGTSGAVFTAVSPGRVLDTRPGDMPVRKGEDRNTQVTGQFGIPLNATAAVLNLTATAASTGGHLSVVPGGARATTSNVNFARQQTVPNLAVVGLGPDGDVSLATSATSVHALVDVFGYFAPAE
jgi:hypothetical protein